MATEAEKALTQREVQITPAAVLLAEREQGESLFDDIAEVAKNLGVGGAKGMLRILGLPGEAANVFAEAPLSPFPPLLALQASSKLAKSIGIPLGGENLIESAGLPEPETTGQRFTQNLGEEGAMALLPFGAIQKVKNLKNVPSAFRNMVEFAKANPFKFLAGEEAIAGAVATTRTAAEEAEIGPVGQLGIELGTSLVAGKAIDTATGLTKLPRAVKEAKTMTEAAEILQAKTVNVDEAIKKLEQGGTPGLTPAAITEDPGLLAQQRGATVTPVGDIKAKQSAVTLQSTLRKELEGAAGGAAGADPFDAKRLLETRAEQAFTAVNKRIDKAVNNVNRQLASLPEKGATRKETMSVLARKELEQAVLDWRTQEEANWEQVAGKVPADMKPLREFWENLKLGKTKAEKSLNKKSVPRDIDELITKTYDDTESVEELLSMRSLVLNDLKTARSAASPDARQISMLTNLQAEILDMIEGVGKRAEGVLKGEDLTALQAARAITREGHDKFFRSRLGQFLGFTKQGGKTLDDELFLEGLLTSGTKGGLNADALFRAIPTEEASRKANDFLLTQFNEQVVNADGILNVPNAERFLKQHDSLLSREAFKDSRQFIQDTINLGKQSDQATKIGQKRIAAIQNRSKASLFLNAEPKAALREAINNKAPIESMKKLVTLVSNDKTGEALNGLRRTFFEEMTSRTDPAKVPTHLQLKNFVKKNRAVMSELYDPDQLKRIDSVVDDLRKAELVQEAGLKGSPTVLNQNALLEFAGRVGGASLMRFLGFGTIQATGAGARIGQQIAKKLTPHDAGLLIEDAIFDPELAKALLMRPNPRNTPIIIKRLRAHLFNNFGVEIEEEEVPVPQRSTEEALQALQ